ncbi:N-6 DNA methylase [Arenimonas sp. MALMAid1274]|uniref:N-6 DNA methylase n=1 Tax=Arenimonas sp. MALMAid1274 TaxID=3411630 RepID=UPI003B9F0044
MKKKFKFITDPKVRSLVEAIRRIPEAAAASPREQLHRFAQYSLLSLEHSVGQLGECCPMAFSVDPVALAFRRIERPRGAPWLPGEDALLPTYLEAVKAAEPFEDLLTPVFAEMGVGDDGNGQHFTPSGLSAGMVRFLPLDHSDHMLDMCCGSGALMLAMLQRKHREQGPESLAAFTGKAVDLDPLCIALAALQLIANQWVHGAYIGLVALEVGDVIRRTGEIAMVSRVRDNWKSATAALATDVPVAEAVGNEG